MIRFLAPAFAAILIAAPALSQPAQTVETDSGPILVDMNGMTLYTFDNDTEGVSNCYDQCAVNWPILAAAEGDVAEGDWAIITRTDGSQQWTYKGWPLYTFIRDAAPGDVTGDGANEVWHVARP